MTRSRPALLAVVAVVVGAALALALALAAQAPAQVPAPESLTLVGATPGDGGSVPLTPTGGIPWNITIGGPPPDAAVSITVSSSPATLPDGVTLADNSRVDLFFLVQNEAAPTAYSGRSDPGPHAWSEAPATYYWQVRATWTDAAGVFHAAVSPIARLGVGVPAAPAPSAPGGGGSSSTTPRTTITMSALDATFYVRTVIRQRTKRSPRNLRYHCVKVNSRSFRCRPSWRDSRSIYSSTTVTFTHERSGQRVVARGTFRGRRASVQCTRTRSVRSCGRSFTWHVTTAGRPIGATRSR